MNAKSVMNLLTSGITQGERIVVECSGDDEAEMMNEASRIIEEI